MTRDVVWLLGIVLLGVTKAKSLEHGLEGPTARVSRAFIDVPVDHFRLQDNRFARFIYDINDAYYNRTGPIFIYMNDLNQYTTEWLETGLIHDLAQDLGGVLVTSQLRYFGQNLPTENATWENLSLLIVEQILGDVATIIYRVKADLSAPNNTQVFVWGPGYGGTFAVLARQKYPHLIHGAWSTGGIFEASVSTTQVYNRLANIISEYGGQCSNQLAAAFASIDRELGSENATTLMKEFSICRPWNMDSMMDRTFFIESLIENIIRHINQHHSSGVQNLCAALNVIPSDSLRSFARWTRFMFYGDSGNCFNYDSVGRHRWLSDSLFYNPGTASGRRQKLYLQCTQLGQLFVTAQEQNSMFGNGVPISYRTQLCEAAFGTDFNIDLLNINVKMFENAYGGRQPGVDHVIFSNGQLDAAFNLGISEDYYKLNTLVVNIAAYGKAADLQSPSNGDSVMLYTAKAMISNTIRQWVGWPYA